MRGTRTTLGSVAVVVVSLATASLAGAQAPAPSAKAAPTKAARSAKPIRTAWGDPDLQGIWTGSTITPLERPTQLGDKQFLTDDEVTALEQRTDQEGDKDRRDAKGTEADVRNAYNDFWWDRSTKVVPTHRTSLIVDPPNGRLPFTPDGQKSQTLSKERYGKGPYDSFLDLDTGERCLTDGLVINHAGYNNNYQIVQAPGYVVIMAEMFRDRRIVSLDGRPHTNVPQWAGESRGRWEGDTLVVETTNLADKKDDFWQDAWKASRPTTRVIERFTRVDAKTIDYSYTVEDPTFFTRPWTANFPLTSDQSSRGVTSGTLYEYACHEGNYGLPGVLLGARIQERAAAGKRGSN